MRRSTREQLERAVKLENEEFAARVRSAEAKEAFTAFLQKRAEFRTSERERKSKSSGGLNETALKRIDLTGLFVCDTRDARHANRTK